MQGVFGTVIVALLLSVVLAAPPEHHDHKAEHHDHKVEHHHHLHHGKNESHPHPKGAHDICHILAPHNADFAFHLYRSLSSKSPSKNVFFSPLSIASSLALLSVGAKGQTHSEIYQALGYSNLTSAQVNQAYEHLYHMLGHSEEAMQLDLGNALAIRNDFKPVPKFVDDAKHYYHSEGFTVDFKNTDEATKQINAYIAKKTGDKITDMVKDLDPATAMMLINYIVFRGKWDKPFEMEHTHKADFHVDANTKVTVDMMKRSGRYDIFNDQENKTVVVMLPYKGNASMMIVMPDEGKMKDLESYISKKHIKTWHDSMSRSNVEIHMPRFSASATYSLEETLKEMGITHAFSDQADFSGLSEDIPLHVSKASHKAVISVDEKGTEAAAVTTMEIMPMSMPVPVKLTHPFMMLIVEESTKSILFMGKIVDPTAK